jgi:hypothetical protein
LRNVFTKADQILQLFQERPELQQYRKQTAVVQKKLHSLTVQHNYIGTEQVRIGDHFRMEIDEYSITADTTEVQKQRIDTMWAT